MKLIARECPNCGGEMSIGIADDVKSVFCPYCGGKFFLDEEKREVVINERVSISKKVHVRHTNDAEVIKATNKADEDRRSWIAIAVCLAIVIAIPACIFGGLAITEWIAEGKGEISAGYYRDLVGKDVNEVKAHLEAAGFENIELVDLGSAGVAFWKDGEVSSISIGGDTSFESSDWFAPDTKVVISYY